MNWLRRLMYGRYGFDSLSNFLLITALILYVLLAAFDLELFLIMPLAIIAYTYFRCFSKNIQKRYNENIKFKNFFKPVTSFFSLRHKMWRDRKTHKYFKCPQCKQNLRVPKGKGKIQIKCPKCKQGIITKS